MKIDFLEGPVTCFLVEQETTGRRFWIFGDQHFLGKGCTPCPSGRVGRLEQFISEEAMRNPQRNIDVILESTTLDDFPEDTMEMRFNTATYIQMLDHFFYSATLKAPCSTYYPNVRLHLADARQVGSAFQGIIATAHAMAFEHVYVNNKIDAVNSIPQEQYQWCILCLEAYLDDVNVGGIFAYQIKQAGVGEKIATLTDPVERQLCESLLKLPQSFHEIRVESLLRAFREKQTEVVYDFLIMFQDESVRVMDANVMAVLLSGCRRAVIFVGLEHAETYRNLLVQNLGFKSLWPTTNQVRAAKMKQCIDFRTAPWPYFTD